MSNISVEAQVYVVTLAREGSFHRAARLLNITQPALSRRIRQVEQEVGVKLFDRKHQMLELTEAGRLFLPEAQASMRHAQRAWELARCQSQTDRGPLRIGQSPGMHCDLLPLLQRWRRENDSDERPVKLESAITIDLKEQVLQGKLDLSFGLSPVADPDLWVAPVLYEPFCLCVPKNHTLATKVTVSARDIDGEVVSWLPRRMHPELYDRMAEYVGGLGVRPASFHEVSAMTQALDMVAHGFGLALLPRSASRFSRTGVVFKPLADLFLRLETVLFVRQDRRGLLQDQIRALLMAIRPLQEKSGRSGR